MDPDGDGDDDGDGDVWLDPHLCLTVNKRIKTPVTRFATLNDAPRVPIFSVAFGKIVREWTKEAPCATETSKPTKTKVTGLHTNTIRVEHVLERVSSPTPR